MPFDGDALMCVKMVLIVESNLKNIVNESKFHITAEVMEVYLINYLFMYTCMLEREFTHFAIRKVNMR